MSLKAINFTKETVNKFGGPKHYKQTSEGALHSLFYRNVGKVQLLWHEGDSFAVHAQRSSL